MGQVNAKTNSWELIANTFKISSQEALKISLFCKNKGIS